jgi:hypothetical protein
MSQNGYGGLCSTCDGRATCTFPRYEGRPRIFCEEFDWAWQRRMELSAAARLTERRPVAQPAAVPRKESRYKGLCATCDEQNKCTFPKSGEGVWHCEEFV